MIDQKNSVENFSSLTPNVNEPLHMSLVDNGGC